MVATAVVHTTGINWQSLGVIIAAVATLIGILTWHISRRDAQHRAQILRQEERITHSVDDLRAVLLEKLETKENVAAIRIDMATLKADVSHLQADMAVLTAGARAAS